MKTKPSRPWWRGQRNRRRPPAVEVTDAGTVELSPAQHPLRIGRLPFAPVFNSPWFWPFFISGATAVVAGFWIFSLPPVSDCRNVSLNTTDAERLYCADMAARRGNINALMAALDLVSQWPQDHPLYAQAQRLSNEWSQAAIVIARRQFEQGNVDYAKTIIQKVPKSSQHYTRAQTLLTAWTTDEGSTLAAQAESAINGADWPAALDIARRLSLLGSDHWSGVSSQLVVRINQERKAWGQLEEARGLAGWLTANELVAAILLAQKIDPNTIAGERVPEEVRSWIAEVLKYAQEWQATGNIQDAVAIVTEIAPALKSAQLTSPLLELGLAEAAANQGTFWGYWEALTRLEQIPTNDPSLAPYLAAQDQAWRMQLQNLGQLQLARTLGGLEQTWAYQLAMEQAQTVTTGQPRRIEAQTLIAQWQRQKQTGQMQPLLKAAEQLAQAEDYTQASQIAQRIPPNHPLYATAQSQISDWQATAQAKIDQPRLDRARDLAAANKLTEAIAQAQEIPVNSPLYREAQTQINDWYLAIARAEAARRPRWFEPSSPEPVAEPATSRERPTPDEPPPPPSWWESTPSTAAPTTVPASPTPESSPVASPVPDPTASPPDSPASPSPEVTSSPMPSPEATVTPREPVSPPSPPVESEPLPPSPSPEN